MTNAKLMCVCGRPVVKLEHSAYYLGLQTVNDRGGVCCSLFEGEYPSAHTAGPAIAMQERYMRERMARAAKPDR